MRTACGWGATVRPPVPCMMNATPRSPAALQSHDVERKLIRKVKELNNEIVVNGTSVGVLLNLSGWQAECASAGG
ncbi:hypothetical protein EON67_00380 [archaeon]|nr:MAG: hypothetical protein EON67_00380 [archaeon]